MEINRLTQGQTADIKKLVGDVFMKFEAPDYSHEGIKAFFDTARLPRSGEQRGHLDEIFIARQ